jgi:hypothetical protein
LTPEERAGLKAPAEKYVQLAAYYGEHNLGVPGGL